MKIKSVELRNVKSYKHETIEFSEGINGICGMNGNGKTTILEAIGYALFDSIHYNTEEFVRHGEKSGMISVTVEGNDEIEYTIQRKIGGSEYFVRTPVGEIRGKKDVTDWISKNLMRGIGRPEDLASIFENAVGVPQGTFTTSFLLNPGPRKNVFNSILRVDEYQTAYANLRAVINSIEKNIDSLERELLPLSTRTERYEELTQEKKALQIEIESLKKEVEEIERDISVLKLKKEDLTTKKSQIEALSARIANEEVRMAERQNHLAKAMLDFQLAQTASNIITELLPIEETFKKNNLVLKGLNEEKIKRDRLKEDCSKLDLKINILREKLDRSFKLSQDNDRFEQHKKELLPSVEAAKKLEDSIKELQKNLKEPMAAILSELSLLREKQKRMEEIRTEIEKHQLKKKSLSPLREKQLELESRIKELKEELENPLRELLSQVISLRNRESQTLKLKKEITDLVSRKKALAPEVEKVKTLEDELRNISSFLETLSKISFDLTRTTERTMAADTLSSEMDELEKRSKILEPMIEDQAQLEAQQLELSHQQVAVNSLLNV